MRKTVCLVICIILMISMTACGGDISNVQTKNVASEVYSEQDIASAIEVIKNEFRIGWNGCELKEIYYAGDDYCVDFADFAKRYDADEVIVLMSTFYSDNPGDNCGLNSDFTYSDWNWILVRSKGGQWKHVDHGMC